MESPSLTCENEEFFLWDSNLEELEDKTHIISSIMELASRFGEEFFKISRGNTEQINKHCEEVYKALSEYIPNFNRKSFDLTSIILENFNNLHLEVMELQVQKARTLLQDMREKYKFDNYFERILLPNQKYEDKHNEYLNAVFELKEFRAETLKKIFLDKLLNFITNANSKTPSDVEFKCCVLEEEYIHEVGLMVAVNKRKIEELFLSVFQTMDYRILTVKTVKVYPGESMQLQTRYSVVIEKEEVGLRQVVQVSQDAFVVLVSLRGSNKSFLVLSRPDKSVKLKGLLNDSDVVIVSGSNHEHFFMFYNTAKIMVAGYILKNSEFVETSRFEVSGGPNRVLSAGYLVKSNEVLYLSDSRVLSYRCLGSKARPFAHLEQYNYLKIESNGDFIFLISDNEVAIVDNNLQIIHRENARITHCFMNKKTLILANLDRNSEFSSVSHELSDEFFSSSKSVKTLLFKARHEIRSNFRHGINIFSNLLGPKQYTIEKPFSEESKNQ